MLVDVLVEGDDLSMTERSVDAQGSAGTVSIRARFDNQIYPVSGYPYADGFAVERVN